MEASKSPVDAGKRLKLRSSAEKKFETKPLPAKAGRFDEVTDLKSQESPHFDFCYESMTCCAMA